MVKKSWKGTYINANNGLQVIKEWFDSNALSLNTSKTTVVPFSLRSSGLQSPQSSFRLKIHHSDCSSQNCECPILTESSEVKYLGITIDQHLRWNKHITYLCNRLRKTIYIFVILRSYLPINILRLIYLALFQSILQYGILGWGNACISNLTPLILIQKRIIKICLNKPIDYSSELLFTDFNVLKIKQIYYIALLIFMHKNRNKFKLYHHKYGTKRSDFIRLEEPKCFTSTALSHGTYFGPRLYNKIIDKHPNLENFSIRNFKNSVRNLIFKEYILI